MDSRNTEILRAAQAMFARYGYGKTTMGDIAAEAGVARQTVYNAFPSKTEVLRAVVRLAGEDTLADVKSSWELSDGVDERLAAFQQLAPLKWYEALHAAPDWAELMEGVHDAACQELSVINQQWLAIIHDMLAQHPDTKHLSDDVLTEVVEFFYSASVNAKYGADDAGHLKRRLGTIKTATLALIASG